MGDIYPDDDENLGQSAAQTCISGLLCLGVEIARKPNQAGSRYHLQTSSFVENGCVPYPFHPFDDTVLTFVDVVRRFLPVRECG